MTMAQANAIVATRFAGEGWLEEAIPVVAFSGTRGRWILIGKYWSETAKRTPCELHSQCSRWIGEEFARRQMGGGS
jgi:hypothetical protein